MIHVMEFQKQVVEMNDLAYEWFKEMQPSCAPSWRSSRYTTIHFEHFSDGEIVFSWDDGVMGCYEEGRFSRSYEDFQKWLDRREERIELQRQYNFKQSDLCERVEEALNGRMTIDWKYEPNFTIEVVDGKPSVKLNGEDFRKWYEAR